MRKSDVIQVRVTPEQKAVLRHIAAKAGITVSDLLLKAVLPPEKETESCFQTRA